VPNRPLHITIADTLRQQIFAGEYAESEKLPTEPELARIMGVSRATLREALKNLEGLGLVIRRHGVGTFVQSKSPALTLNLSVPRSITALIQSLGFMPGTPSMSVTTEQVFPDDVERFEVGPGTKVVRIERLRTANSQPVAYTINTVPAWVMSQYPERKTGDNFSLVDHLTYRCGVRFAATSASLIPLHNISSVAEKLEIDPSSHIFFIEGLDRDTEGRPVMFSREYFAPWIFRLQIQRTHTS